MPRAVFLDRDGTVVADRDYLDNAEGIALLPGAGEALATLSESGFLLVLVTNQSGVGRGYFPIEVVKAQHERLGELLQPFGVRFADIQVCPHEPAERCSCRKPAPGMLLAAAEKLGLDLTASFMVGDKDVDVEAGKRAGCTSIILACCDGGADHAAVDLADAARWIVERTAEQKGKR